MPSATETTETRENNILLSWNMIRAEVNRLQHLLREESREVTAIVGITRGGLIPAVLLSHAMGIPSVRTIQLQLRDGACRLEQGDLDGLNHESVLVLDDLWDTGATLKHLRRALPKPRYATLFHKTPAAREYIEFPGGALSPDQWVVFPWENPNAR